MPRLTESKWRQVRTEFETTKKSLSQLAGKYNVSKNAISKKSLQEGWVKNPERHISLLTNAALIDAVKVDGKLGNKVYGVNPKTFKKISTLAATRAQVIMRHREQWVKADQLQSCAFKLVTDENGGATLAASDMDAAKLANLVAKTYEIIQRNEREAWNLERQGIEYQLSEQQIDRRRELIQAMIDGKIDIYRATALMDMEGIPIPDFVKVILSRTPVQEKEPEIQEIPVAELDSEYEQAMNDIRNQKEKWLPEREAEIRAAKEEIAGRDTFKVADADQNHNPEQNTNDDDN